VVIDALTLIIAGLFGYMLAMTMEIIRDYIKQGAESRVWADEYAKTESIPKPRPINPFQPGDRIHFGDKTYKITTTEEITPTEFKYRIEEVKGKDQNGVHKCDVGTRASSCQVDSGSGGYNPNLGAVESGLYPTENRKKDKDGEKPEVE